MDYLRNLQKFTKEEKKFYSKIKASAAIYRAINHTIRQRIIKMLNDNKFMTVTDVYIKLRCEQSVASQHLAILRKVGIVATERQGKFIYYSVDNERLKEIEKASDILLKIKP